MLRRPHDEHAPAAQAMLHRLAWLATVLHVRRATARGRRHGAMCESLEAQREWLAKALRSHPWCDLAAVVGLPVGRPIEEALVAG